MDNNEDQNTVIGRKLVDLLMDKIDKCNWKRLGDFGYDYILSFPNIGAINLCQGNITIFNVNNDSVFSWRPVHPFYNDIAKLAQLNNKVQSKVEMTDKTKEEFIESILRELDSMK